MLFDDRDLSIFDNADEKEAFREVLQTYYSGNYRATVVSLYSLVMFDLYNKLQYMAEEGEIKAKKELKKVNTLIQDDEKYSMVENVIVQFFVTNCNLYFSKFQRDINYLKDLRNDCAHLKVNSQSLLIPKDYQVKMLISSMFENLFSVKAPFLEDLFCFIEKDIEAYSADDESILLNPIEDSIHQKYRKKYFSRMTQTSLLKSLRTFLKLLFITDDEDAIKNARGLYVILRSMLQYIDSEGLGSFCAQDSRINDLLMNIGKESLERNSIREDALYIFLCSCRWFCDIFRKNDLFSSITNQHLFERNAFEKHFKILYPELHEERWKYYLDNSHKFPCRNQKSRFDYLRDANGFSDIEFIENEIHKVGNWNGYDNADAFMRFLTDRIEYISDDAIKLVIDVYNSNDQFYERRSAKAGILLLLNEVKKRKMKIDWTQYKVFSSYVDALTTEDNTSNQQLY
ncbi:MAG: hypothetical protein IKD68_00590 [Solobacterium sp.]|nr:hypothetical protein [Solobacterium sp.]